MVLDASDYQCLHSVGPGDSAYECPHPLFEFGLDQTAAALGAEDAMNQIADVGMWHLNRPFGTTFAHGL